ncbi:uncharacterized protein LOC133927973 [Phragmites australis]|uniref:uncharacterized protein LOC133927973 n=1 Tax=Phragmites australis TaxID=29695 RepID=UPI002D782810|nr:uncharacterized protein LOC133927973 [Phragmites australis]
MDEIKENPRAWKWLSDIDSKHWSRHKFSTNAKTDLVVNNISESYNAWILEAREEPMCTMMEHNRTKLMESISIKRDGAERDTWVIPPNYKKRLELEKKFASIFKVVCAGRGIWQVTCKDSQYVVDLDSRKCGYYKWDVTGVPCCHAIAAIHQFKHKPEDYISPYFTREKNIAAYEGMIMPIPDKTQWLKTDFHEVDPPLYHAQPGRLRKKRVKAQREPHVPERASKKASIRCSNYHTYGHNVKGCGLPIRPDWEARKGAKFTRHVSTSISRWISAKAANKSNSSRIKE